MSEQHCTKDLTDLLFSNERLANMNNLRKVRSYQASYHSFTRTSSSFPKGRTVLGGNSTQNAEFMVVQEGEQQSLENMPHAEMESRAQSEKKYALSVTEKGGPKLKHSRSVPIPFTQMVSCDDLLDECEENRKFDRKTWAMYNRITSHRKAQGSTTRIQGARKTFPRLPDVDDEGEYNGSNRSINSNRKRLDDIVPFFPMS